MLQFFVSFLSVFFSFSGLPTQIRDAGLSITGLAAKIPVNTANREWYQQQAEKEVNIFFLCFFF